MHIVQFIINYFIFFLSCSLNYSKKIEKDIVYEVFYFKKMKKENLNVILKLDFGLPNLAQNISFNEIY